MVHPELRFRCAWVPLRPRCGKSGAGDHTLDPCGRVHHRPQFGNGVAWLEKFEQHGDGVCLVPDRTSAPWWQRYVPLAELVLFVGKKIRFIGVDGQEGKSPAQGTCLYSFGLRGRVALENAARCGLGALMIPASTVKSDRSALKLEEA